MAFAGAQRLSLSSFSGTKLPVVRPKAGLTCQRARLSSVRVDAFKVTFKMPEGETKDIEVPDETYILDAADDAGLDLPYSCRSGTCSTCAAKVLSGDLDQSDQQYLDDAAIEKGYALICVGYAKSDLVLETHKEEEAMDI